MKALSINCVKSVLMWPVFGIFLVLASCEKVTAEYSGEEPEEDDTRVVATDPEPEHFSYHWDFEGPGFPADLIREVPRDAHSIVSDPTDPGNRVMRSIMAQGAYRSEVRLNRFFDVGTDFWIGFRMMRPNSGHYYPDSRNSNVVNFQVGPISFDGGSTWHGLHQLQSNIKDNHMRHKTFPNVVGIEDDVKILGPGNWGNWEKWVIHSKFRDSENGILKIWRNDVLVHSNVARNGVENAKTMIKWGAYIGANNQAQTDTEVYFDDITIMGANGSYNDVAP